MLRKIIFLLFAFLAFICSPVWADTTVEEVELLPNIYTRTGDIVVPIEEYEFFDIEDVKKEIEWLENKLPKIKEINKKIYMVKHGLKRPELGNIAGLASKADNKIFLLSYENFSFTSQNLVRATLAHEIGHLVRFNYISDEKLQEYLDLRKDGEEHISPFDKPEEIFAEDFWWLFGSEITHNNDPTDWAFSYRYKPTYSKPGEKEKQWILEKLGMEYIPPKVEEIKIITAPSMLIAPKPQPKPNLIPVKKPVKPIIKKQAKSIKKPIKKVTKNAHKSR